MYVYTVYNLLSKVSSMLYAGGVAASSFNYAEIANEYVKIQSWLKSIPKIKNTEINRNITLIQGKLSTLIGKKTKETMELAFKKLFTDNNIRILLENIFKYAKKASDIKNTFNIDQLQGVNKYTLENSMGSAVDLPEIKSVLTPSLQQIVQPISAPTAPIQQINQSVAAPSTPIKPVVSSIQQPVQKAISFKPQLKSIAAPTIPLSTSTLKAQLAAAMQNENSNTEEVPKSVPVKVSLAKPASVAKVSLAKPVDLKKTLAALAAEEDSNEANE